MASLSYTCKGCGKQATNEQILNAAGRVNDLDSLLKGQTPWICAQCHLRYLQGLAKPATTSPPLNLATNQQLIDELRARFQHCIIAFRSIPVEGQNEAMEGLYHSGDYRMCQGLALGMANRIEREIQAACTRREEEDDAQG